MSWPRASWSTDDGLIASLVRSESGLAAARMLIDGNHYRRSHRSGAWVALRGHREGPLIAAAQLQIYTGSSPVGRVELASALGEAPPTGHRASDVDRLRPLCIARIAVTSSCQGTGIGTRFLRLLHEDVAARMVPLFPRALELMRRGQHPADEARDGFLMRAGFERAAARAKGGPLYYFRTIDRRSS